MRYFTWKLELVSDILLLIVELLSFHSVSIFWLSGTVSEKLPGGLYLTEIGSWNILLKAVHSFRKNFVLDIWQDFENAPSLKRIYFEFIELPFDWFMMLISVCLLDSVLLFLIFGFCTKLSFAFFKFSCNQFLYLYSTALNIALLQYCNISLLLIGGIWLFSFLDICAELCIKRLDREKRYIRLTESCALLWVTYTMQNRF